MSADPPSTDTPDATVLGKAAVARHPLLERGTCVGRYLVLDPLGQGGMGVVYKAYDPELDRPIALKLLRAGSGTSETQRDRLLREAQALARLAHPNVLGVHDVGTFRGDVFIAMEFIEGDTLRSWIAAPGRSQRDILEAFLAAGDGLAAAHRAGLVHRDFKPDNVMVGKDGRVRVLDFGLARTARAGGDASVAAASAEWPSLDENAPTVSPGDGERTVGERPLASAPAPPASPPARPASPTPEPLTPSASHPSPNLLSVPLTRAGATVGTPRFMAPEQHLGEGIDARADQFSFCVSLYSALYRGFPFVGETEEMMLDNILRDRVADPPPGAAVPRWLRQVLLKGMSRRPEARHPSMETLLQALRADPRAERRRWLAAASLVFIVASVGVAWRAADRREARVCAGAAERLKGAWDDSRRAAVRAAFRKSGKPYAEAALGSVERSFDAYAAAWTAMHVDSCEATQVRHEQSQELLDLRTSCLTGRLTSLKTLAEEYSSADDAVIKRAAQAAQSLPDLALCADSSALKAPVPPPRDPAARRRVDEVRLELARAHALGLAAHFDDALRLARRALAEAEALHYAPLEAAAQLQLGELLGDHGDDFKSSTQAFQRALTMALVGHDEETAASAAVQLIYSIGVHLAHYEEAERWAEVADALTQRVQRATLRTAFFVKRSDLYRAQSKYEEALRDAMAALELEQHSARPDQFALAKTYDSLGQIHFYRAEYAAALADYERALAIEQRVLGPDHPLLAGVMIGMADVYGESGEHERALAGYRRALEFLARVQPDHPNVATTRNNMGLELLQVGRPREAFDEFKRAYDDWQKRIGPSVETVLALGNQGFAKIDMGQPAEALVYFHRAVEVCHKVLGPDHAEYARVLGGIADADRKLGRIDEALATYRQALAVDEKALGPKHPHLIDSLKGIARVELDRHAAERARPPLERALTLAEAQPDPAELAEVRFLLAQALWGVGEPKRALALAAQAREAFAKGGAPVRSNLDEVVAWLNAPARRGR